MEGSHIIEDVIFFDTAGACQDSETLVDESNQTDEQGIDELVFVGQKGFITEDI